MNVTNNLELFFAMLLSKLFSKKSSCPPLLLYFLWVCKYRRIAHLEFATFGRTVQSSAGSVLLSEWDFLQSGSMETAFYRGDLLFLTNRIEDPIRVGEIVVFRIEGREIPIVHRVLKIHEKQNGDIKFLTKGDNNAVDDRGLYKQGQHWLEKKDVVGRARGCLPKQTTTVPEERNGPGLGRSLVCEGCLLELF
ncbi:signal peptidase complex catalytic subunit SEC11A isoform X2 [Lepidochelys kempii]|uniref:signal peptidase complex catalytic subunit SEC11A isoform X2 n=1 Tax=Lepidochelys kempii TaxID=8472 RepID=UPI003C6EF214